MNGVGDELHRPAKHARSAQKCAAIVDSSLTLYRGAFLEGEGEVPAVVSARERLRSKFLACICRLGASLEHSGRFQEAISCYQQGLEAEAVAEELYLGLMRCHSAEGRRSEAMAAYLRCKEILAAHLESSPSAETNRLYQVLKRTNSDMP